MKFAKEVLDAHNKYRRMHGVQPLTLSTKVNCHKKLKGLLTKFQVLYKRKSGMYEPEKLCLMSLIKYKLNIPIFFLNHHYFHLSATATYACQKQCRRYKN